MVVFSPGKRWFISASSTREFFTERGNDLSRNNTAVGVVSARIEVRKRTSETRARRGKLREAFTNRFCAPFSASNDFRIRALRFREPPPAMEKLPAERKRSCRSAGNGEQTRKWRRRRIKKKKKKNKKEEKTKKKKKKRKKKKKQKGWVWIYRLSPYCSIFIIMSEGSRSPANRDILPLPSTNLRIFLFSSYFRRRSSNTADALS